MLLRAMRSQLAERGLKLPAIAMTAYGTQENRDRAIEAGFDVYLTKPLDPLELGTAVAQAVRRLGRDGAGDTTPKA